jgi:diguanylate cyclase (GGDEF)-like protein
MTAAKPATATVFIAGLFLGAVSARPKLRRVRTELAHTRRQAEHDPLTGLPNRAGAQRHRHLAAVAGRAQAAVLLDLDKFKAVNDTWGHQAGDALLVAIAGRLAQACIPVGAVAARLSGDEFLLLLPYTDPHALLTLATTVLDRLREPVELSIDGSTTTTTIVPSASAGIALPEPGDSWADLLRRADIALYHAKAQPGQAVLHTFGMRQPSLPAAHHGPRRRDREPTASHRPPALNTGLA